MWQAIFTVCTQSQWHLENFKLRQRKIQHWVRWWITPGHWRDALLTVPKKKVEVVQSDLSRDMSPYHSFTIVPDITLHSSNDNKLLTQVLLICLMVFTSLKMEMKHFIDWYEGNSVSMDIKIMSNYQDVPWDGPVRNAMVNPAIWT